MNRCLSICLLAYCTFGCSEAPDSIVEGEPFGRGPYSVGSTNMEVAPSHAGIGDEVMNEYLIAKIHRRYFAVSGGSMGNQYRGS